MREREEYAVYNGPEIPRIERNLAGKTLLNCFTVTLERQEGCYMPYRFVEFIADYTKHKAGTCSRCIAEHARFTYPVGGDSVDRSAVDEKFFGDFNEIAKKDYYYCPLVGEILDASSLSAHYAGRESAGSVEPIHAILNGGDDKFFFEFSAIRAPATPNLCAIYRDVFSSFFTGSPAERSFLKMWFLAMHLQMDRERKQGKLFLEEEDFGQTRSKLLRFIFPIPQAWVRVKAATRFSSLASKVDKVVPDPQRVDFLVIYEGVRHVIEVDDVGHYGERDKKNHWQASELAYRRTLVTTRALERAGYKVHRFTNEEIVKLERGATPDNSPDVEGFIDLLRSSGFEPERMVFISNPNEVEAPANPAPAPDDWRCR